MAQGDHNAAFNLGVQYELGTVVPKDIKRAYALYVVAADKGLPRAKFNVCNMLLNGNGVDKDAKKAYPACLGAAQAGFRKAYLHAAVAAMTLGDKSRALELFSEGARLNVLKAAEYVGMLVTRNMQDFSAEETARACDIAGRHGDVICPQVLARMYQESNPVLAYTWFRVFHAAVGQDPNSLQSYFAERLDADSRSKAEADAAAIVAALPKPGDMCEDCTTPRLGPQ